MKTPKSSRLQRRFTGWRWTLIAVAVLAIGLSNKAAAVTLHPGDIIVAGRHQALDGAVFRVDPVTGEYTVISDNTHGSGPRMYTTGGVTLAADGQLWVTDRGATGIDDIPQHPPQILKIDPTTGNRVAIPIQGLAGDFGAMAREVNGQLIVEGFATLYRLNPSTGAATEISGPHAGSGPAFSLLQGFAISANSAFVSNFQSTFRVDLTTGARTIISGSGVGTGPTISPVDVALDAAGFLIETVTTTAQSTPGVFRVDPATGNRVAISSPTVGGGEPLSTLVGLGIAADGSIFTAARSNGIVGILKVDPTTGNREWLANLSGTAVSLSGVTIVPANVPEPATIALAAVGGILLLLRGQRLGLAKRRQTRCSLVVLCLTVGVPNSAPAATLHPGDIVVAGQDGKYNGMLFQVDPFTGAHAIISDNSHGAGPLMHVVAGVTMASDGQLWVVDIGHQDSLLIGDPTYPAQVLKVNPVTGDRVAVPNLTIAGATMAREHGGQLVVSVALGGLALLNPSTGASTAITGGNVGSGPAFTSFGTFALDDSNAFATDFSRGIFRIDLTTGARTIVSGINVGAGPVDSPIDVAFDSAGNLIATTASSGLLRIDPTTGNRIVISSDAVGTGPATSTKSLEGLAIGADGSIFTAFFDRSGASGVLKIDPSTGNRQLLASLSGEASRLYGVAVVPQPVPEPATIALAALAGFLLFPQLRRLRALRPTTFMIAIMATAFFVAGELQAVTLHPGDLVVAVQRQDYGSDFWRVDPVTGERTVISDGTHGAGPMVHGAASFVIAPDGQLLVADQGSPTGVLDSGTAGPAGLFPPQMLTIDPTTGDRTLLPVPASALADRDTVIAGQISNQIIASSTSHNGLTTGIISVDRLTGAAATILTSGPGSGSSTLSTAYYMAIRGDQIFAAEFYKGITQIDLNTLARTPITSIPASDLGPLNLAFDLHGDLIFSTYQGVFRVDPVTRNQTPIPNDSLGTGPSYRNAKFFLMTVGSNDAIYLMRSSGAGTNASRTILQVDPITGDRRMVADLSDLGRAVTAMAVVPASVPEPSTITLGSLGGTLFLALRRRRARAPG